MSENIPSKCPEELAIYNGEPDLKEWEHQGFKLSIKRHVVLGHLCGYIDIPLGHPWFRVDLSKRPDGPDVHGGFTFADLIGDNDGIWRLGFDCAHYGDAMPGNLRYGLPIHRGETYKNMDYVTKELESVAEKAKVAALLEEFDRNWPGPLNN